MGYKAIELQCTQGVALVWLNRPEARNALDPAMVSEIGAALDDLESDASVRALVFAGRGTAFCAGLDLGWLKRLGAKGRGGVADARRLTSLLHRLYAFPKPTVARVHGCTFAGGLGLIAACDIAIAAQDAEFCLSEVRLGLAATTIMPYIVRAIGERHARRYALSAERFSAAEAYRIGLVHDLALPGELDGTVNRLLGELVQGAPAAQANAKEFAIALAGQAITEQTAARSAARFSSVLASKEARGGIDALLAKQQAPWMSAGSPPGKRRRKTAA